MLAKPIGMAAGAAGGVAFKSAWRRMDAGREVPDAHDEARSWKAVLIAAALQGAVFAVIHAVVDRAAHRRNPEAEAEVAAQQRQAQAKAAQRNRR
jgi:hypothetical protein